MPAFVTFEDISAVLKFFPTGTHCPDSITITIELSDSLKSIQESFTLYLIEPESTTSYPMNSGPPLFMDPIATSLTLDLGQMLSYPLPSIQDPDGDSFTLILKPPPPKFKSAVQLISSTRTLVLSPSDVKSHVGTFSISLILRDDSSQPLTSEYTIAIQVNPKVDSQPEINNQVSFDSADSIAEYSIKQGVTKVTQVNLRYAKVNQRGKLTIEITPGMVGLSEIIGNETLALELIRDGEIAEKLNYTVVNQSANVFQRSIDLLISFQNPGQVSRTQELDSIRIKVLNTSLKIEKQRILVLYKGSTIRGQIPPQLNSDSSLGGFSSSDVSAVGMGMMAGNIILNIVISGLINQLWKALSELSSLTILFMIAIPVQGVSQSVSSLILQFAQMDILPSDIINSYIFSFNENDQPLNPYFDIVGQSYTNSVRNMGSTFLFFVSNAVLLIFIGVASVLGPNKLSEYLKKKFLWNHYIRFILQQFVTLYLSSIINFNKMERLESGDFASYIVSIFVFAICIGSLMGFIKIIDYQQIQKIEKFEDRFGTLTTDLRSQGPASYYQVTTLLKWMITLNILVFLSEFPGIQVTSLYLISIIQQGIILSVKPFQSKHDTYLAFINEFLISITLLLFMISSDLLNSLSCGEKEILQIKFAAGIGLLSVLSISSLINLGTFAIVVLQQVSKKLSVKVKQLMKAYQKNKTVKISQEKHESQVAPFSEEGQNHQTLSADNLLMSQQFQQTNIIKQIRPKLIPTIQYPSTTMEISCISQDASSRPPLTIENHKQSNQVLEKDYSKRFPRRFVKLQNEFNP
ncbi:hypothetical protein FGO68_gene9543 [Halteria grandinella]|uniref:Uncharacterized protein n=1 Tax=Halteria grandinella TaxID=5974 RepID=A0A8J8P282_HALGN|nr:hypothetical protein FGO68_gene9543 [Halteria grandinella]